MHLPMTDHFAQPSNSEPDKFAQYIIGMSDEAREAFVAGVYVGLAGTMETPRNDKHRDQLEAKRQRLYDAANRMAGVTT